MPDAVTSARHAAPRGARRRWAQTGLALAAVLGTACGGDGESSAPKSAPSASGPQEPATGLGSPSRGPSPTKSSSLSSVVREATERAHSHKGQAARACRRYRALAERVDHDLGGGAVDLDVCIEEMEAVGRKDPRRLKLLTACIDDAADFDAAVECAIEDTQRNGAAGGRVRKHDKKEDYAKADSDAKAEAKAEYFDEKRADRYDDKAEAKAFADSGGS